MDRRPFGRHPVRGRLGGIVRRRRTLVHGDPHHDPGKDDAPPKRRAGPSGDTGPFAVSRNPIYLANTLLMIGVALISGIVWFLLLAIIAAFATQKMAIEGEEKVLATKFGKKYRDYAKKVRRWI